MLKEKLKELRISDNMTQEQVAEQLGVSAQTVSKWERGLLSPDISLLPKIAELYDCTIDSLFGMKSILTQKHMREFGQKCNEYINNSDWENEYRLWLEQIEKFPDTYPFYSALMRRVLENRDFRGEVLSELMLLTENAERNCTDHHRLDTIHYLMVEILGESGDKNYTATLNKYYEKLPSLHRTMERLSKYVLSNEAFKNRQMLNISFSLGLLTDSILNLRTPEMSSKEQIYYYKKAIELIEAVTEGNYAGHYEIPLLGNYYQTALLLKQESKDEESEHYINKIFFLARRHMNRYEGMDISKLTCFVANQLNAKIIPLCEETKRVLELIEKEEIFSEYREKATELKDRYIRYFNM